MKPRNWKGNVTNWKKGSKRATEELKLYVSGVSHNQAEREKSVRDQLQHKIFEQEKLNAQMRQEHRRLKENLSYLEQQMSEWGKIEKCFYNSFFLL
jgi:predicted transposase YbfD/YdcC